MRSFFLLLLLSLPWPLAVGGETLPLRLAPYASGLKEPVSFAPDGAGNHFVVEQQGRIQRIEYQRPVLYLDISDRVHAGGECGLLGLAFDPKFSENGRLYVNYTTRRDGPLETIIASFTAKPGARRVDPASEVILLRFRQPYSNHNGGQIAFGPDGMLYIGVGDGGSAGDPELAGQDLGTVLGKILRVDVSQGKLRVPQDNPFVKRPGARPEIWAYGLRNPWRFSFDRKTGDLWAADVGQNRWEEIDLIVKGGNYGWSAKEGSQPFKPERADGAPLIDPVKEYSHREGQSITGGYVYRGKAFPALQGVYLYGDFVTRKIWGFRREGTPLDALLFTAPGPISAFGEDEEGELYLLDYIEGKVYAIGLGR